MTIDQEIEQAARHLLRAMGLQGLCSGSVTLHFDGDGRLQTVNASTIPWRRRSADRKEATTLTPRSG